MSGVYSEDCTPKEQVTDWIDILAVLSKNLLSDVQFIIAPSRIDYISVMLAAQERAVSLIKYFCRPDENCKICEKIQQYKALVQNARQELEDIRQRIHMWKLAALKFTKNVNSFIRCLIAHEFEDNCEEKDCETKMQRGCSTGLNNSIKELQGIDDDSEGDSDGDTNEDETDDCRKEENEFGEEMGGGGKKIVVGPILTTEQEFKHFSTDALGRLCYKMKMLFREFKHVHHSHLCTLLALMHQTKQAEIKYEIVGLLNEIM